MLRKLWEQVILNHHRAVTFIILESFLLTFTVARATVYLMNLDFILDFYIAVGQTHLHHLNYGIFLLAISGYLSLIYHSQKAKTRLAIIYGIGLGLTFDEFALWLFLENDYYARASYEAIIIISAVLVNIVYFGDLWNRIFSFLAKKGQNILD